MEKIRELMEKLIKSQNIRVNDDSPTAAIQKRIRMQIMILVASVLLVVVLIFAMTAAWFTNVAKTSDLVFQTESWGFDENKITLQEETIPIAPGTSGIVPLSIDNSDSTESVQIGVTISKIGMVPGLQKRIFFYADTAKANIIANEGEEDVVQEEVSRTYLGTSAPDNYTYTILPGQILTLNELFYNDVPIKWEWVYDMVGYYFRGTVDKDAEEAITVDEYIRPIEYDYEQAVFELDETTTEYQQLKAVGNLSVEAFLKELSSEDGYKGTIDYQDAVAVDVEVQEGVTRKQLYYPVETDSKGYGIWAYLCTLEEIEEGIAYDTEMANSKEAVTAKATIVLTAYNLPAQTENVNTEAAFKTALSDEKIDVVKLEGDILSGSTIDFSEGSKIIDLNGYSLQYDGVETEYSLLTVADGAKLTLINGSVTGNTESDAIASTKTKAVEVLAGDIVLSDVKIDGFDSAVVVQDMNAENGDSVVQLVNCDFNTEQITLVLQGNGNKSDAMTKAIIQNSKLNSEHYVGISGQGNDDRWGTELVVAQSEISGCYAGIYQPQRSSVMTVTESAIKGNTGIAIKGGTVNIYNSKITGTGEFATDTATAAGSGFTDTGDGVYVEAVYDWSASVNIKGEECKISSEKSYAVELFGQEGKGPGRVNIYDGTLSGAKGTTSWNNIGTFENYLKAE